MPKWREMPRDSELSDFKRGVIFMKRLLTVDGARDEIALFTTRKKCNGERGRKKTNSQNAFKKTAPNRQKMMRKRWMWLHGKKCKRRENIPETRRVARNRVNESVPQSHIMSLLIYIRSHPIYIRRLVWSYRGARETEDGGEIELGSVIPRHLLKYYIRLV